MVFTQTKGVNRNTIDKYYTKHDITLLCLSEFKTHINISKNDMIIEPSAGNGSFINGIKMLTDSHQFYDIKPEHDEIIKKDYLSLNYDSIEKKYSRIHVIGNPPFGRQSSLAIKFIKKSCEFAYSVSFILPKSFKKESMRRHFPLNYHLINEINIPDKAFLLNDKEYNVPCVFQIWEYKDIPREKIEKVYPIKFDFVNKRDNPDISFRRVGINAGTISNVINSKSEQSHYFIKFKTYIDIEKLKNIKFASDNTVGPKSISKQELIIEFNKIMKNI